MKFDQDNIITIEFGKNFVQVYLDIFNNLY